MAVCSVCYGGPDPECTTEGCPYRKAPDIGEWKGIKPEAEALVLGLAAASTYGSTRALAEQYVRRAVAHGYHVGLYHETQGEQPLGTALRIGQSIADGHIDPMHTRETEVDTDDANQQDHSTGRDR